MRILVRLSAGILGMLVGAQPGPARAQQEAGQTVLIGAVAAPTTNRGHNTRDAVQFAVDEANRQDIRIAGKKIQLKLFIADDRNDPKLAVITAGAAVKAGVVAMLGHMSTHVSIAVAPIYRDAGIPQISPTAAGRDFTRLNYPTIFQMLGNSDSSSRYLVQAALEFTPAQRIVVVDDGTVLGIDLSRQFVEQVQKAGGRVLEQARLDNTKTSDFNAAMAKIRSANADLVFFAGLAPQTVAFSLRMRQLNITCPLLLASGGIQADFPQRSDAYPEGTLLLAPGMPVGKMPDFKRLEKAYKENFKAPLVPQTWFAYDAVNLVIAAMKQADSTDPRRLSAVLREIRFNGMTGPVAFDAEGNRLNPRYTLYRAGPVSWQELKAFP